MQLATSSTSDPLPMPWVERIFARLEAYYGTKLANLWGGTDLQSVKRVWSAELAGYSSEELVRGIEGCRARDWPPTLPEFLKLCRPAIDPVAAWYEAQHGAQAREKGELGDWSHPAIFHAYTRMGWEVKTGEWGKYGDKWSSELRRAQRELEAGALSQEIPAPALQLPAPQPLSREEASKRAAELNVPRPGSSVIDRKAWARALKARELAGDRLTLFVRRAWREALGEE